MYYVNLKTKLREHYANILQIQIEENSLLNFQINVQSFTETPRKQLNLWAIHSDVFCCISSTIPTNVMEPSPF
jgi:hypothetical protein